MLDHFFKVIFFMHSSYIFLQTCFTDEIKIDILKYPSRGPFSLRESVKQPLNLGREKVQSQLGRAKIQIADLPFIVKVLYPLDHVDPKFYIKWVGKLIFAGSRFFSNCTFLQK